MLKGKNWEKLYSIFDIAGKRETGITQSFGVILRKDKTLLNKLIHLVIPHFKINNELFKRTEFSFEKSSADEETILKYSTKRFISL